MTEFTQEEKATIEATEWCMYPEHANDTADDDRNRLIWLWARYFVATERHDRTFAGGWSRYSNDEWVPHDRSESEGYARKLYRGTQDAALSITSDRSVINNVRQWVGRMTFNRQVEITESPWAKTQTRYSG